MEYSQSQASTDDEDDVTGQQHSDVPSCSYRALVVDSDIGQSQSSFRGGGGGWVSV